MKTTSTRRFSSRLLKWQMACLFFLLSFMAVEAQQYVNPISGAEDPFIFRHNGWYYLLTTGNKFYMMRGKTLESFKWVTKKEAWSPSGGDPAFPHILAPEMFQFGNKWYVYFSGSPQGSGPYNRTHVLESSGSDPWTSTYTYKGQMYVSGHQNWYALDHTLLRHNGNDYVLWSGVETQNGLPLRGIYIAELSNAWTITGPRTRISIADKPWEGVLNEAPSIMKANGKIFVSYSGGRCPDETYALGLLWMPDNLDPMVAGNWNKYNNPVFTTQAQFDIRGPGHNDFFQSPDGTEWYHIYHATTKPGGDCGPTRSSRVQRITFDGSGFPIFGNPIEAGIKHPAPSGEVVKPSSPSVANGKYRIQVRKSGHYLDVEGNSRQLGANVHQWGGNSCVCQEWWIQSTPVNNQYVISSRRGGYLLEVAGGSTADGANVSMWKPTNGPAQLWEITDLPGGYKKIINVKSGKSLDIVSTAGTNYAMDAGANLQQWPYNGQHQQQFMLTQMTTYRTGEETEELESLPEFCISPNPSFGTIRMLGDFGSEMTKVELFDLLGKRVKVWNVSSVNNEVLLNSLDVKPGVYSIRVRELHGEVRQSKVIIGNK